MKKCIKCLKEKEENEFYNYSFREYYSKICKECIRKEKREYAKKMYKSNPKKLKEDIKSIKKRGYNKKYQKINSYKYKKKRKIWFKKRYIPHPKILKTEEEKKKIKKDYYLKNKDTMKQKQKEYNNSPKSKKRIKDYNRKYYSNLYKTNINYKIRVCLCNRINQALKNNYKKTNTINYLGCSIEFLKTHLEKQFDKNMSWNNYGSYWEIDHIKPCYCFDLRELEEQKKCFNYKNLQPLEISKNRSKGKKYTHNLINTENGI